jgi:endoglycosylceramidase
VAPTGTKRACVAVLTIAAALVIGFACGSGAAKPDTSAALKGPLSSNGRWLTDASGRVVLLHGFNQVSKLAPYYPTAFGFDDDDATFLADNGFNVVRVGVVPEGLLPAPGTVDATYIEHLAQTVDSLARHQMFVLLDFHQDGYAPMFNGNGFPDWMAVTDGAPNPKDAVFPLYYVQNPAMQRAFDHFWANSPGPDGVGLQDAFMKGFDAVVQRFAGNPWVLGYEPMNEPWPGSDWVRCTTAPGCPDLEMTLLKPFYQRALDIVRHHDNRQFLFVEPFVLFNFGKAVTSVPAIAGPQVALSFHSYALDIAGEQGVVRNAAVGNGVRCDARPCDARPAGRPAGRRDPAVDRMGLQRHGRGRDEASGPR